VTGRKSITGKKGSGIRRDEVGRRKLDKAD